MIATPQAPDPFPDALALSRRVLRGLVYVNGAYGVGISALLILGLELLHLTVGAIAATLASSAQPLDIHWSFSITPWIAVLLLFVLARVFAHGARLRADLEGTV